MRLQCYSNGERISVGEADLLGSGGEARVYTVPPDNQSVAKIYHRPTTAQIGKLRVMLENPPDDPTQGQAHNSIAWPRDLLSMAYGERGFAGYLMPRVPEMRPLFEVYNPSARRRGPRVLDYRYLHRAARNLASAVRALHNRGYVVGDVNESNILVSDRALITLVDTDSFQVTEPGSHTVYRCPVGKAEYTPPELQGKRFSQIDRTPAHDRFGLAVLIFQMLMEGTHPFAGLYLGGGEPPPYEARIVGGGFAYGNRSVPYQPMPAAPPLELLDPVLRQLFLRCFEDGHSNATVRPDAQTWQHALAEAEKCLTPCSNNPRHLYGRHLTACPWCLRTNLLGGRDPFPATARNDTPRPRRIAAASLLPATPSAAAAVVPGASGSSSGGIVQPSSVSNWQTNAPLTASFNGGTQGALPTPTLFSVRLSRNGWAWGALFWAALAIAAVSLGMPGLNWATTLLALACGAAGWHTGVRLPDVSRWMAASAALCAAASCLVRPLASAPAFAGAAITAGAGGVRALSFSPDGAKLAVGTSRPEDASLTEGEVNIWDVSTRRLESTPEHASGDVVSVSFSPDGRSVAAATDSPFGTGEVVLLDVTANGAYRSIFKQRCHMRQVAWSPSGSLIATAGAERLVRTWDAKSGQLSAILELPAEASALAFSSNGRLLAVGCRSPQGSVIPGIVSVWEAATGKRLWVKTAHGNGVQALAFAPNCETLASAGCDAAICLWEAMTGDLHWRRTAHSYGIAALSFSRDNALLATAETRQSDSGSQNEIVLRDASSGAPVHTLEGGAEPVQALAFSPMARILASGGRDGNIRFWAVR